MKTFIGRMFLALAQTANKAAAAAVTSLNLNCQFSPCYRNFRLYDIQFRFSWRHMWIGLFSEIYIYTRAYEEWV